MQAELDKNVAAYIANGGSIVREVIRQRNEYRSKVANGDAHADPTLRIEGDDFLLVDSSSSDVEDPNLVEDIAHGIRQLWRKLVSR